LLHALFDVRPQVVNEAGPCYLLPQPRPHNALTLYNTAVTVSLLTECRHNGWLSCKPTQPVTTKWLVGLRNLRMTMSYMHKPMTVLWIRRLQSR